jgi:hypothetical protein
MLHTFAVVGEGRRGPGHLLLARALPTGEGSSTLPPVIAFGALETTQDILTVTVREFVDPVLDVEILSSGGNPILDHFEEKRRWTYSTWQPGEVSPATGGAVREVGLGPGAVLALAPRERRLWLYDAASGMVRLLPLTGIHHELMVFRRERDPGVALHSERFFDQLVSGTDEELRASFVAYNLQHPRVDLPPAPATEPATFFAKIFHRRQHWDPRR